MDDSNLKQRALYTWIMVVSCALIVSVVVWSMTLHVTPLFLTFSTCMILEIFAKKHEPNLHLIFFRSIGVGIIMLGAWWAINNLGGVLQR